jgi:hypothetical protein
VISLPGSPAPAPPPAKGGRHRHRSTDLGPPDHPPQRVGHPDRLPQSPAHHRGLERHSGERPARDLLHGRRRRQLGADQPAAPVIDRRRGPQRHLARQGQHLRDLARTRAELARCDFLRLRSCLLREGTTAALIFAIGALVGDIANPSSATSWRGGTIGTGIQSPAGTAGPAPLGEGTY